MVHSRWIFVAALFSFSAFAGVSFEEKKNRVDFLEELSKHATSMNIDAYHRELNYEKLELSLEKRAENEAQLLAQKIKLQISKAYEAALESHGNSQSAAEEVRNAILKDLELVDASLKDELQELSLSSLEEIQRGEILSSSNLVNIEKALLKGVKDRSEFLNAEAAPMDLPVAMLQSGNKAQDSDRKSYSAKREIIESLVSNRDSAANLSNSATTLKSANVTKIESRISLQVKVEFLGVGVEAGPSITFKRSYSTNANIVAEGLNPAVLPDGNFDMYKRDNMGRIIQSNGRMQKRLINFACNSSLDFETDYTGAGGFSVAGIGASASVSRKFSNSVHLTSRRISVPESIDGRTVTYKNLSDLCHTDFLNARITNNLTVAGSLNIMMRNIVSGLRFSHPKTKCATDNHCINWYNREVIALVKIQNFPRCVEERTEKYRTCELRGLKGQNCAVFDRAGKRLSSGMYEFACDKGLKCVQTQEGGWFRGFDIYQYAKGKCMPINAKTYRSPLERANKGYIEVELR